MEDEALTGDLLAARLRPLVGDLRQFASVRRLTLDDGPERGVRALAFSTGGGLDFWVMVDRGFDIGPLWFGGSPLAWQAPAGFAHPGLCQPEFDGGYGARRLLCGLLMSCGLDHVRQPAGGHPLHGRLHSTPARVLSACERWDCSPPMLEACAELVQASVGGENLRLLRHIRAPIGGSALTIRDCVTNDGAAPQVHDLLYHFNLGYPAIADGTTLTLNDALLGPPLRLSDTQGCGPARCVGSGDPVARLQVRTPFADGRVLTIGLEYASVTLPYLQIWQDLRPRCGLLAIEPCVSARDAKGGSVGSPLLAPGESRDYRLTLSFQWERATS